MSEMYKQCELSKPLDGGLARMVSWIPDRFARPHATVSLRDTETGVRTSGWFVEYVAELAMPAEVLLRQSRDHLRTRDASDI